MPSNKDFARRIEILDECLRRRQKRWFIDDLLEVVNDDLIEKFGKKVSKRTLYNDLEYLQNEKQAPIVKNWEGQRVYYKYEDATYSILNLPISEEEVSILRDAIKVLKQVDDFKIVEEVDLVIEKLAHTISTNVPDARSMIQFEKHTYADGADHIDNLFTAIKDKSVLKIQYQPFSVLEPEEWIVHPYLLKEFRNRWFLICRIDGKNKVTNLALDRIKKIKSTTKEYCENNLFDPETFYDHLIGVSFPENEGVQDILLKVVGNQINYVKTKPIHKSQEIVDDNGNEGMVVKLKLVINYEFQSILLSYMPYIEILQPKSLREELLEKLAKAKNLNK